MIRNLAQCPYCGKCEIALDDSPALVFNPGGIAQPCEHLAWVDGRYSQWEPSPQGVDHMIGSTEFRWEPSDPGAAERTEGLLPYLKELANQGPKWAFAPPVPFTLRMLVAEEKRHDESGDIHTRWDVDGWAIFASDIVAFWAALPACQERQLEGLRVAGVGG
jgi:hypothetical protein